MKIRSVKYLALGLITIGCLSSIRANKVARGCQNLRNTCNKAEQVLGLIYEEANSLDLAFLEESVIQPAKETIKEVRQKLDEIEQICRVSPRTAQKQLHTLEALVAQAGPDEKIKELWLVLFSLYTKRLQSCYANIVGDEQVPGYIEDEIDQYITNALNINPQSANAAEMEQALPRFRTVLHDLPQLVREKVKSLKAEGFRTQKLPGIKAKREQLLQKISNQEHLSTANLIEAIKGFQQELYYNNSNLSPGSTAYQQLRTIAQAAQQTLYDQQEGALKCPFCQYDYAQGDEALLVDGCCVSSTCHMCKGCHQEVLKQNPLGVICRHALMCSADEFNKPITTLAPGILLLPQSNALIIERNQ